MLGIGEEFAIVIQAFLTGVTVYSLYGCIRIVRRLIVHNLLGIGIEDFIFWIAVSIYLFVNIYYTSDGAIRWYFVLGVVFGLVFSAFGERILKNIRKKMYMRFQKKYAKPVDKTGKRR